ncbi:sigma-70 family RNA polymerase sigma factor [Pseudomonas sp. Irchel s3a10]|uniref:sigma-70 family RNA polymerase sigma factor n=1 Tax=Pseudomonas sp. Irchel s3a10 TaxID=2009045 RepID=UPI003531C2D0
MARLWRYGLLLSRNRHVAEDLVQATCVRALERAGQYVAGTRMDRWLLSILHSIWLNEVRVRRVRQGAGQVDADGQLAFAQTHVLAAQVIRRVDALPETQRETVYLAYVEGLSYRDVAEILQVPIGTVMSRLATARLKLAEYPPLQAVPQTTGGDRS